MISCHPELVEGRGALVLLFALTLAACSGNYSTGPQIPSTVPPGGSSAPQTSASATPAAKTQAQQTTPGTAVYPLADAPNGFACPDTTAGFSCTLRFNAPPPTPTPKPGKPSKTARPTSSPEPVLSRVEGPSPTPVSSASPAGSASPSATASPATITLHAAAKPKDAPAMVHVPQNALNVVPLMMVTMNTSADFVLNGLAIAEFTLPKEEIPGRGFALQLFQQRTQGKNKSYSAIWILNKASLQGSTLTFSIVSPKFTVAKGNTYVIVLYGTDISQTPSGLAPSAAPTSTPTP